MYSVLIVYIQIQECHFTSLCLLSYISVSAYTELHLLEGILFTWNPSFEVQTLRKG
jgi:hypothetical protein